MKKHYPHTPYRQEEFSAEEMIARSESYFQFMDKRRSLRYFSDKDVPKKVIENIIKTASTAPSGAHKQPWKFCVISNTELKSSIRATAEKEEYDSYNGRMKDTWLEDLEPLGTDWVKEFIDLAPWIVVIMKVAYEVDANGEKHNNYYVSESVGIAAGFLLSAIHHSGLVGLTHTPSPMNFLAKALNRPENERPFLLVPIGYPAEDATVPELKRKGLNEVALFYE